MNKEKEKIKKIILELINNSSEVKENLNEIKYIAASSSGTITAYTLRPFHCQFTGLWSSRAISWPVGKIESVPYAYEMIFNKKDLNM